MTQAKEYFASISYQRKDEKWADRLRNKLEHYRLPSSVRKQEGSPSKPKNANIDIRQTARVFDKQAFADRYGYSMGRAREERRNCSVT